MQRYSDPALVLEQTRLVDRFLDYVRYDTRSDARSDSRPTTEGQRVLLRRLAGDLEELGLDEVELDDQGFLTATLPGNVEAPVLGLIAHVDTAPAFSGTGVEPQVRPDYDGRVIELGEGLVLDPAESPELAACRGHTLVTTDGTTLLGADDKAGVAEILAAVELLLAHPELSRPTLRLAFTPDEEIGRGTVGFPYERFGAAAAVTLDGGPAGEVSFETFSADSAYVTIEGVAVHPGSAKDKLVNALEWMARFLERLPPLDRPEHSEGRQGFIHIDELEGNAARAKVHLLLRDFEDEALAARGRAVRELAHALVEEEPRLRVEVEIERSYRNMRQMQEADPRLVEILLQAVRDAGVEPVVVPVRGGTDGSTLTENGLPTPNLFAGGVNLHGPQEWVSTTVMAQATCAVVNLVQHWADERSGLS